MADTPQLLLVGGVVAVGVLHTIVPDHWLPITILARQQGWSRAETAWAAARAGCGHVASTLVLGLAVWLGGATLAARYGAAVDLVSGVALILFGAWIALSAWRELRGTSERAHSDSHSHGPGGHHHHHDAPTHRHDNDEQAWFTDPLYMLAGDHPRATAHDIAASFAADPPVHQHRHRMPGRAALVLILGSSPMVEGLPAFFAAGSYGPRLIAVMALAFALSTVATYVVLCVGSTAGLQQLRLGRFERYGEVASGALIAVIGLVFGVLAIA